MNRVCVMKLQQQCRKLFRCRGFPALIRVDRVDTSPRVMPLFRRIDRTLVDSTRDFSENFGRRMISLHQIPTQIFLTLLIGHFPHVSWQLQHGGALTAGASTPRRSTGILQLGEFASIERKRQGSTINRFLWAQSPLIGFARWASVGPNGRVERTS